MNYYNFFNLKVPLSLRTKSPATVNNLYVSPFLVEILLFPPKLDKITSTIVISSIWVFAIYSCCVCCVWLYKFIKCKKSLKNLDLYNNITNAAIRNKVVQSQIKIKCLFATKTQAQTFFEAIESEINKQKKLMCLKNYEN